MLLDKVWPESDQVFWPTEALAATQVLPLSSDTSTNSPASRLTDNVPEMV